jgi:hypothetical protein
MVRPAAFGFNRETASSNAFQRDDSEHDPDEIGRLALDEFDHFAAVLREHGVHVVRLDDTPEPRKPDAVFPNNWVSFHAEGDVILYPMLAPSRRAEARSDVLDTLASEHGLRWPRVHDLRDPAVLGGTLEGTGSLVLDRGLRLAYASLSPRTEAAAVQAFCRRFGYEAVLFHARDANGRLVYHTNVVMTLAERFAVVCLEAVVDTSERRGLMGRLEATGRDVVEISRAQMACFAGNMLELRGERGERLLVASTAAVESLGERTRSRLGAHASLVSVPLPTIERLGGGSARCMLVELLGPDVP